MPRQKGSKAVRDERRRRLSRSLIVVGSALLLVGGAALYARAEIFDADAFSRTAAQSLRDDRVRAALADPIVEQIVDVGPDQLINAQPLLEGVVTGVLDTGAFRDAFRDGVRKAYRALFEKDPDQLVLTINDINGLIVDAASFASPQTAKQIPNDVGDRLIRITDSEWALRVARLSHDVRVLGLVLPPLALLALIGGVAVAPDRRRGLVDTFIGVAVAGAVGFIGLLVTRTLLLRGFEDETVHDAVAVLFDDYLGGLGDWMLLGGVVAVALAAAAAATEPKPLERPRRLLAWIARTPEGTWTRVGRALVIGLMGVVALLEPGLAVRIFAVLAGAVAIYYAVVELIAAVAPAPAPAPAKGRAKKAVPTTIDWRTPAIAGSVIVAAAAALAFLITDQDKKEVRRPIGPVTSCNGYAELCDRRVDEVAFASAHNAMSAAELPGWFTPNNRRGIPRQLEDGIRGLLIDTHYGLERKDGTVLTDLSREDRSKVIEEIRTQLGPEAVARFQSLSARLAGSDATPGTFLCHVVCELGATELTKGLVWVREFLDAHPDEFVVLFIEDKVSPEDTAEAFEESGLLRYAYVHKPGTPFPTLRKAIESDKRVFVMAEEDIGGNEFPWYHQGFDLAQETPYTFKSQGELTDFGASCIPNRGAGNNPLFQLNHWIESIPRSPDTAGRVNEFKFLLRRARECDRRRGLLANLLAVDFYDRGDVLEVARVLNGLPRDAEPSYRKTG